MRSCMLCMAGPWPKWHLEEKRYKNKRLARFLAWLAVGARRVRLFKGTWLEFHLWLSYLDLARGNCNVAIISWIITIITYIYW